MDLNFGDILDALGGGLSAVVIFFLGYAVVMLWKALNAERAGRMEDLRDTSTQLRDLVVTTNRVLDTLTSKIKEGNGNG